MSEAIYTLDATVRTDKGTGASRRLRHTNQVPAILYGADKEPENLALAHNKVWLAQEHEGFYSHILTLNIDGTAQEVILKDVQRHPYNRKSYTWISNVLMRTKKFILTFLYTS